MIAKDTTKKKSFKMTTIIQKLVEAAEREGGICNIKMCGGKIRWRDSILSGVLWYNDINDSTHVIKIEEEK